MRQKYDDLQQEEELRKAIRALYSAVIIQAFKDLKLPAQDIERIRAVRWFNSGTVGDFNHVCDLAGFSASTVRRKAQRVINGIDKNPIHENHKGFIRYEGQFKNKERQSTRKGGSNGRPQEWEAAFILP